MRTLEITEAQASAIIALAGRISADAEVVVETTISEPAPSVTDVLEASPELAEINPFDASPSTPQASSMPTFAPITVEVVDEAPAAPASDARAQARAARKAENKAINAAINGHLGNATKAHNAGDQAAVVRSLQTAMGLVPQRMNADGVTLAWQSTIDRIVAKAQALGVAPQGN